MTFIKGSMIGVIRGDTGSLDYISYLGFLGGLDKELRSLKGLGLTEVTLQWIHGK